MRFLRDHQSIRPTLFLRDAGKLADIDTSEMRIVGGDVGSRDQILAAMKGQDVVYANLSGEVGSLTRNIIAGMEGARVKRLLFITTLGIYDEVPAFREEMRDGALWRAGSARRPL